MRLDALAGLRNLARIACPRTFTRFRRKTARRHPPLISGAGSPTGPLPSSYSPRYLGNFPTPSAAFVIN